MYKSASDTGYSFDNYNRFKSLQHIKFQTILDYGSGCCRLHEWLNKEKIECEYFAHDIRKESLELCNCITYDVLPLTDKYDVVCLFATYDHVNSRPIDEWKKEYENTIRIAKAYSSKYLIFTGIKDTMTCHTDWGQFSKQELINIANKCSLSIIKIDEETEPTEYILICEINDNEPKNL